MQGAVVAIGNFDGVHKGHQQLLHLAQQVAAPLQAGVVALTFEPHPKQFFMPYLPPLRLTNAQQKVALLKRFGAGQVVVLPFEASLAAKKPPQFVQEILLGLLQVQAVVTGADFRFGKARSGDAHSLHQLLAEHGIGHHTLTPQHDVHGHRYAASAVRELLQQGKVREANEILGHPWTIEGLVLHGDARGRQLGFPTANLALADYLRPLLGVYAVRVRIAGLDGRWHDGVANLGRRPTVDGDETRLEVHLLDFMGDLYGRVLEVALLDFVRPELKFPDLAALRAQIAKDCDAARSLLAKLPPLN